MITFGLQPRPQRQADSVAQRGAQQFMKIALTELGRRDILGGGAMVSSFGLATVKDTGLPFYFHSARHTAPAEARTASGG
ncbi:MAG: hypothetical protein JNK29_13565 [Anaerolineales bacterium]|nr:hypothetical protein [Anaerolineales bacterium]